MEVNEPKYRAAVGILIFLPWALTVLVLGGYGYLLRDWRWLSVTTSLPCLLFLPMLLWVPVLAKGLGSSGSSFVVVFYILHTHPFSPLSLSVYLSISHTNLNTQITVISFPGCWTNRHAGWSCAAATTMRCASSRRQRAGTRLSYRPRRSFAPSWTTSGRRWPGFDWGWLGCLMILLICWALAVATWIWFVGKCLPKGNCCLQCNVQITN